MAQCAQCTGSGMQTITAPCRHCNGTGEVIAYHDDGSEEVVSCIQCEYGLVYIERTCSTCQGTGEI